MSPAFSSAPTEYATFGPSDPSPDAAHNTLKELTNQLDSWLTMLPQYLRWPLNRPAARSSSGQDLFNHGLYVQSPLEDLHPSMFTSDLDNPPVMYPYAGDVQVALLRTRYYYARYLIYRPFLYKAVHHSDLVTQEDAKAAAECLKACLRWPITMSPICCHKRLVPCLLFWSQNLLGILIILHLSQQEPMLRRIRTNLCGSTFEAEAAETENLYIDWIRDLKNLDPTAAWCWGLLRGMYELED